MYLLNISKIVEDLSLTSQKISNLEKLYIFGRNPELSLAEIIARYNVINSKIKVRDLSPNGVIIESKKHISTENCGAVLKKCKIITVFSHSAQDSEIKQIIHTHLNGEFIDEKSNWGISSYNDELSQNSKYLFHTIRQLTKQGLKKIGIKKAFYIPITEGTALQPQKLHRKKVIEKGIELILWYRKNDVILCQTEEVIDIDSFAIRDKNRPHKRLLLLLGLALARTMVNLVSVESNHHHLLVFDPFCGMGSIVQEAYILGLKSMGSDIDPSCVTRSQENLHWISQNNKIQKKKGSFPSDQIFEMDLTQPNKLLSQNFQGSIVAEPNLLTPLKIYPPLNEAKKMRNVFEENYNRYLNGIRKILPSGGVCVLIFPQIHTSEHNKLSLNLEQLLRKYNFKICEFKVNDAQFPAFFIHSWKKPIIERQILVFKKI